MLKILLRAHFLIFLVLANHKAPEVKTAYGILKGKYQQTWEGRTFSAFTGIPYAKPPVEELRFKAPVPADPWTGVLDASKPIAFCPQMNIYVNDHNVIGDEDCLYLNVYTPQLSDSKDLLPVMFYIHGGAFTSGSSSPHGPTFFLDKDIVLVTTNYRLGPLGFLSTGDEIVPGNNGLKDQNLALKWVTQNIADFGGDSNKITIVGHSAGGISAHYHTLSPLSRDLIKGAIVQSGSALALWSLASNDYALKNTKKLAELLDCPTTSSQEIVDCLRKVEAYDVIKQEPQFLEWSWHPMVPFRPVIEPRVEGAFLTEHPKEIIKSGKAANIPLMTGVASEDGAFKSSFLYNHSSSIKELNDDFNKVAPLLFLYDDAASNKDYISEKIRKFYFGELQIDDSTKTEATRMFTDGWFLSPADVTVRLHTKYSKQLVYYYLFAYRGSTSFTTFFGGTSESYGVCHCDELLYLFNDVLVNSNELNELDKQMIDMLIGLWTNFVKTGNPTPPSDSLLPTKWEPVSDKNLEYYLIKDANNIKMSKYLHSERAEFWRNILLDMQKIKNRDEL